MMQRPQTIGMAVTLLPATGNISRLAVVLSDPEDRDPEKKSYLNHRNLPEAKQLSTLGALLYRLQDEGCPCKLDARPWYIMFFARSSSLQPLHN